MTPQDVSDLKAADKIRRKFRTRGQRAVCYGMGDGLDEVKKPPLRKKYRGFSCGTGMCQISGENLRNTL